MILHHEFHKEYYERFHLFVEKEFFVCTIIFLKLKTRNTGVLKLNHIKLKTRN